MNIEGYWIYGYRTCDLGKHQVEDKVSCFYMNGKRYVSTWYATQEISNSFYRINHDLLARQIGGEEVVGYRIEGEINRLNWAPDQEILDKAKKELTNALEKTGFTSLPEPKLYFMVEVSE